MPQLSYKKGLPTKPGWYWKRDPEDKFGPKEEIVLVRDYVGTLSVANCPLKCSHYERCEWAGPIPKPTELTEVTQA